MDKRIFNVRMSSFGIFMRIHTRLGWVGGKGGGGRGVRVTSLSL